ncbi:hypothetical protein SAMN05428976_106154 [Clostridium sp. USBA 49]|jgi:hypothetical protein|uniref:hypothetical protein n=1 Tax=Clostridium sp. USBA 49 TaxID=1881060 RepID=UPI00099AA0E1|nr:hypothetical protein [Clostridium sp. USBA 49]SKA84299.1 hypothetical protein SAMN05428976_106154 [Clostridium sp. USBA 49]
MNKTVNIARGGLFTALGVLFIYLSIISPTNKLYLLGIASCIIPLSILTTNLKNSFLIYLSTSFLSLLLTGIKGNVIAYIVFFGLYGFVKYYIEKLRKIPLEIVLKLLFFNTSIVILYIISKAFFNNILNMNISIYIILIGIQFAFFIFDYALTLFISYLQRRIKKIS